MKNYKNKTKGFTLLETLVALSILIIAITVTFTAAQNGLAAAIEARDQVVAFNLAQEGVEMVRNLRDENGLQNISWLTGISAQLSDPCYFGKSCVVDATTKTFSSCASPGNCSDLLQDKNTSSSQYGMFGYNSSWSPTVFNREISLTQVSTDEVRVTVVMKWVNRNIQRQFKIHESIFNWQQ